MYNLVVVDDEPVILNSYYDFLSDAYKNELNIDKCNNSSQVLERMNNRIDILVSDIFMPKIDGYELMEIVKKKWHKCRVIFITGDRSVDTAQKAIRSGEIIDYVLKLEDNDVLLSAVNKAIQSLSNEIKEEELDRNIQRNINLALPILRRNFLLDLLTSNNNPMFKIEETFTQLKMKFSLSQI